MIRSYLVSGDIWTPSQGLETAGVCFFARFFPWGKGPNFASIRMEKFSNTRITLQFGPSTAIEKWTQPYKTPRVRGY